MRKPLFVAMFVISFTSVTRPMRFLPNFRRRTYSIVNFLNTSERIWTVQTSRPGNTTCQYDHVRRINPRFVLFNRTLMQGRTRYSARLRGEFFEDHKNEEYVTALDFRPMFRAKLIFAGENNVCGVMKLGSMTGAPTTYYELQVRNSSLEIILYRRCWHHFCNVARHSRGVYNPHCQHLIRLGI
uniref:Lipocalin n=1 Tax=Rhipicephalus zambeziensis TaxID=60191 RepID=A0A224YN31_9ACAR